MRSKHCDSCHACVSVCLPFKSHLTSVASFRPESATIYSVGNEGVSEMHALQRSSAPSLGWPWSAIFPAENTHVHCAYASSQDLALRFIMQCSHHDCFNISSFPVFISGLESSSYRVMYHPGFQLAQGLYIGPLYL